MGYDTVYDITYLLLIPALIFSVAAQIMVKSAFSKYSKAFSSRGLTGKETAEYILRQSNIYDVRIERISGELTDHYDPKSNVIRLSDSVYDSTSTAAIGVAAHETGHAIQYSEGYIPIKVRSAIIPITQIGSKLSMPIVLIGIFLSWGVLVDIGILLYCAVVLFQAVTLPVEFNASGRAIRILRDSDILSENELKGAKKVLTAAALTYVAALASALLSLLRLLLLRGNNSSSRRR